MDSFRDSPENPTETPNTTVSNNAGNNYNNSSGYGLAQSQFNIFNNIYEAEEITFLSDIPENFQLPFKIQLFQFLLLQI